MPAPSRVMTPFKRALKAMGITRYDDTTPTWENFWNLKHIKRRAANKEKLVDFTQETIEGWKMISDKEIGGSSLGTFSIANGIGKLEGDLVTELTDQQKAQGFVNTGFVAVKSTEFFPPEDMEHMDAMLLRIKSDKRLYLCQIKRISPWEDDLYQGIIPVPSDEEVGQWRNVVIPFENFHLTWKGYLEEPKMPFDGRDIQHLGIMMAERKAGPFQLEIEFIAACKQAANLKRYTALDPNINEVDDDFDRSPFNRIGGKKPL